MEQTYAHALMRLTAKGISPSDAVASIASALRARGRIALLPRVGRAYARLTARFAQKNTTRIAVARTEDSVMALKVASASEATINIDDSLIGGWRIEQADTLRDASYKKYLLEIYNRATRA